MTPRQALFAALLALPFVSTAAQAEEKIATTLSEGGEDGHSIGFEYESCGGECYLGGFSCNSAGGNIEFQFGDVESDIAASVVADEQRSFKITAGSVTTEFSAYRLMYQEMTGTWSMEGNTFGETGPLLAAIAKSKTFVAAAGKLKLELPVTDDMKTWVKRCGG